MNATDYLNLSQTTSADDQDGVNHLKMIERQELDYVFTGFVAASKAAERMKKKVYYGRDLSRIRPFVPADLNLPYTMTDLHANLGIMGESHELVESTTRETVLDEGGDLLWYIAKKFRAYGITFEEAFEFNIEKLKARFPHKFDAQIAQNLDSSVHEGVRE